MIDIHTHAFPPEAITAPESWSRSRGEMHWNRLVVGTSRKPSIQGWARIDDFLRDMDRNGIEKSILLGWYWENAETCREHNHYMADWVARYPDRFGAMACVHPDDPDPDRSLEEIEQMGFCGIGELLPQIQGSSWGAPFWSNLAGWASSRGLPLNLHVTEILGRDHPGKVATPLESILDFAVKNPSVSLILSHWGGGMLFYELNPAIRKQLKNVHYDCSASPLLYRKEVFSLALEIVGEEKILFGTDYPLRLYPSTEEQPDRAHFLRELEAMDWNSETRPQFFRKNALKLLS